MGKEKYEASKKYDANNTVKVTVKLNKKTDKAIVELLELSGNKQGLIKKALQEYIEKRKGEKKMNERKIYFNDKVLMDKETVDTKLETVKKDMSLTNEDINALIGIYEKQQTADSDPEGTEVILESDHYFHYHVDEDKDIIIEKIV